MVPQIAISSIPASDSPYIGPNDWTVETYETQAWWLPDSNKSITPVTDQTDKSGHFHYDFSVGEKGITRYLTYLAEKDTPDSDKHLFKIGQTLQQQGPLFEKIRAYNPLLKQKWAASAAEKLAGVIERATTNEDTKDFLYPERYIKLLNEEGRDTLAQILIENGVDELYAAALLDIVTRSTPNK